MKVLLYSILLAQFASILGTSPQTSRYKCWLWDSSSCLKTQIQNMLPAIVDGIPQLGIERLDPMLIDTLYVDQVNLKFLMRNLQVKGLRNTTLDDVSVDVASKLVRIVYHTDILVKSKYASRGYLFSLPIIGEGNMLIKMDNAQVELLMPFDIIRDVYGRDFIDLKGFRSYFNVRKGAQYQLSNLYYGNKQASDTMHQAINQNWRYIVAEYGPYFWDSVNSKIFNAARIFARSTPLNEYFFF